MKLLREDAAKLARAEAIAPVKAINPETPLLLSPYIVRAPKGPRVLKDETMTRLARFQRTGRIFESADCRKTFGFEAMPNGGGAFVFHLKF
jgi:hypothetical protein